MTKKVFIKTLGCQMNERDSEVVMGLFLDRGFKKAESLDEADVVLFNTCSVRKHAEDRAISNMGALLKLKTKNAKLKTEDSKIYGIIGCSAQAMKEGLFKRLPGLDIVCGTGRIYELPQLVRHAVHSRVLACDNVDRDVPEIQSHYRAAEKPAYVLIMRGCDNFCSYCIVPYVRGRERSRRAEDIVNEIKDLASCGIKEIMLLGQNVNSYKGSRYNFIQLLELINDIDGIEKIKFMTSHPKDATIELFRAMKDLDKVAKELHLPLQSGSDRILKLMNRGYTAKEYLGLIKKLRELIPRSRITTDVMVGFPTETENDFKKTYRLMKDIRFDAAYIFKYSPRPPATSAQLKDDVPRDIKERRHRILLDLQIDSSKRNRL